MLRLLVLVWVTAVLVGCRAEVHVPQDVEQNAEVQAQAAQALPEEELLEV